MSAFVVALCVAMLTTPAVIWAARRSDLLDVPNHRSSHSAPVPRGGGIAVAAATVTGVSAAALGKSAWTDPLGILIAAALILAFVGLLDDRRGLPPVPRLMVQLAVPGAAAIASGSDIPLPAAAVVTSLVVAGYVNAFNFMDGINGISGSQSAILGLFLAFVADDIGQQALMWAALAVSGASIGFLPYNVVQARVFLGDVGSYFLGTWLAGVALLVIDAGAPIPIVATPFVLYLGDTAWTLLRRARRHERLMEAHREHTYQRLVQMGYSHVTVAALCAVVVATPSAAALLVRDESTVVQVIPLLVAVCSVSAYLALPCLLARSSMQRSGAVQ